MNGLLKLVPAERIELSMDPRDSLNAQEMPPLTAEQMQETERHYEEHVRNPKAGFAWEEVKARLLARCRNTDPAGSPKERL